MIRIVIADDQMLTREGLRTILDLEDDFNVVGVASNGEEAVELTLKLRPDLLMIDIQMPIMNGIEAIEEIKQVLPDMSILILTTFLEDNYIIEGMAKGANGYLLKDMDTDKMIAAIRDTINGQFILPSAVATKLASYFSQISSGLNETNSRLLRLTGRERKLAELIIQGHNNGEIAAALHISGGTVRNYISSLYGKLEVDNRVQAVIRLQELMKE